MYGIIECERGITWENHESPSERAASFTANFSSLGPLGGPDGCLTGTLIPP